MRIRFIVVGRSNKVAARNLVTSLNSIQSEFDFQLYENEVKLPKGLGNNRFVTTRTLEKLAAKIVSAKYSEEYPVVLCDCRLENDLFSSYKKGVAIISTYGWTPGFSPHHVYKYIMYALSDVLMNLYVQTSVHYKIRGCIGDYCSKRKDINIGLAKCDFCSDCRSLILEALAKGKISIKRLAAIYKILDSVAGRRACFVLMPFDKVFDQVYACLRPVFVKQGWSCARADKIFETREIMTLIWEHVLRSDLIIADLTGMNPNVFYELGYAHALDKNTVLITQSIKDVPFDLRHRQLIEYAANPNGYKSLGKSIKKYLRT